MRSRSKLRIQSLRRFEECGDRRGDSPVFLAAFLHDPGGDKVLEFLVSSQPQHFFSATGSVSCSKVRMDDLKERFEFEPAFFGEHCDKLLRYIVRAATGKAVG